MALKQDSRLLAISTALGPDVLAVRSIAVQEQLSRLFQIEAELSSEQGDIDFDQVIGHNATIRLQMGQDGTRYFNGFVSRMVHAGSSGTYPHYHATIVPWLWFLTRTADCRIFQEMTAPDIIEKVFKGHGFNDYQLKLSGSYQQREFCVQYRETDFNFVSRLMEQEGIYYFFTHEDGKHTLVLADSISAHSPTPNFENVDFHQLEKGAATGRDSVTAWVLEKQFQPVSYALTDFDFTKPKTSLRSNASASRSYGAANLEMFDYPGEYIDHGEGDRLSQVRLDELQAQYESYHGQATARGMATGATFNLRNHPLDALNKEYLIADSSTHADAGEYASSPEDAGEFFSCSLVAIDSKQTFRPARLTPEPVVHGPQTAVVTGPSGEEIYTDQYGRVKVQFFWDRHGKSDENSSCWIRVSQGLAGKKWGAIYLPRVGQEVIVEFLEGDPDRPIITGRVYNGDAMPPYDLPGEKTKSTIKSNSSIGGDGFNEIRFEDKKGDEQIFVHAEKDQDARVKNDSREWVGNDRHLVVENDQKEKVEGDKSSTVTGDRKSATEGDVSETVSGDRKSSVAGDDNLSAAGDQKLSVGGDHNLNAGGDSNNAYGGDLSLNAGGSINEKSGMNHAVDAGMTVHIKGGMSVVIEAGMELSLKAGGNFIDIGPMGVSIQGTLVMINSGGASGEGADCETKSPDSPEAPGTPDTPDDAADDASGDTTGTEDGSEDGDSDVELDVVTIGGEEDSDDPDSSDVSYGTVDVTKTLASVSGAVRSYGDDANNFNVGSYGLTATSGVSVDPSKGEADINVISAEAHAEALSANVAGSALGGAVKGSASVKVLAAEAHASLGASVTPDSADLHAKVGASVALVSAEATGQIKIPLFGHVLTIGGSASGQVGASAEAEASAGYNADQGLYFGANVLAGLGLVGGASFGVSFK